MFYGVIIRLNRPNVSQKRDMLKASTIKLGTSGPNLLVLIRSFQHILLIVVKDQSRFHFVLTS